MRKGQRILLVLEGKRGRLHPSPVVCAELYESVEVMAQLVAAHVLMLNILVLAGDGCIKLREFTGA